MSHHALMMGRSHIHAHWRERIRTLLRAGEIVLASRLADQLLDEMFPTRWSR